MAAKRTLSGLGFLALLLALAGCRSVAVEVVTVDQPPAVVVTPYCVQDDGERTVLAGLSCELLAEDGTRQAWGISGAGPLVLRDVAPGSYELLVRGTGRQVQQHLEVPARGRVSVAVDVSRAERTSPTALLARAR